MNDHSRGSADMDRRVQTDDQVQTHIENVQMAEKLATLTEKLGNVAADVNEIKQGLQTLVNLERTLAETRSDVKHFAESLALVRASLGAVTDWQGDHEQWAQTTKTKIDDRATDIDNRHSQFANKIRGALIIISVISATFSTVGIGALGWTLAHVLQSDSTNALQEQRIVALERAQQYDRLKSNDK